MGPFVFLALFFISATLIRINVNGYCAESELTKSYCEIKHLDLREDTNFTDEQLMQCKNLTSLLLGSNKMITSKCVETLTNLKILDLSGNEQIPFWVVTKLTNLNILHLTNNYKIPKWCLKSLPDLKILSVTLQGKKVDIDFALQELGKLPPLKRLVINTSASIDTKGLSHHKLDVISCEEAVKLHEK